MATPVDNAVALTGNPQIDGLLQGSAWQFGGGSHVLTYSLSLNDSPNGGAWTTPLADAVRQALTQWSNVANVTFFETGSGTIFTQSPADIAITLTGDDLQQSLGGVVGLGVFPSPSTGDEIAAAAGYTRVTYPHPEGDVFLDNYYTAYSYPSPGQLGYEFILHEIGHALGLKHTVDDGSNGRPTFAQLGMSGSDNAKYTVMSANQIEGAFLSFGNAATPMPLDILAIQQIYGANVDFHSGDDTYQLGGGPVRTIWDGGGIDTLDASLSAAGFSPVNIDLRPGGYSLAVFDGSSTVAIAYNVTIENAVGSFRDDIIIGNDADNNINGRSGNDSMQGGKGNDTYVVDSNGDGVVENPDEGIDTVISAVSYDLGPNIENLTLTDSASIGVGNEQNNVIVGNASINRLTAGAGNDHVEGGAGFDILTGGAGNDTYVVADVTTSGLLVAHGDPTDPITQGESYSYGADDGQYDITASDLNHDNLVDSVFVTFNLGTFQLFSLYFSTRSMGGQNLVAGTTYTDAMRYPFEDAGHPGLNFYLNGRGADTLTGSFTVLDAQFDMSGANPVVLSFSVNFEQHAGGGSSASFGTFSTSGNVPDSVVELPGEGADTVQSSISYTLPANVENLTLTGSGNLTGAGNTLDNTIIGNTGNNALAGDAGADILNGGIGADALDGGAGIDTANYAGSAGVVVDLAGGVAWDGGNLDTLTGIENATGSAGADQLWGDAGANVLSGGAGNDLLVGGLGADALDGGTGVDTASYAGSASVVVDLAGGVAWDGSNLDTLVGTENATGSSSADQLWGNAGANVLSGGAGNDLLVGWLGADTLDGGAGTDTVSYAGHGGVVVDLAGGVAWDGGNLDTLTGIENATGSAGGDQLWGDAGANVLDGGQGADYLNGGAGSDTVSYAGSAGVVVDLAGGVAWDGGSLDTLVGIENAIGSSSADQLWGDTGANVLTGEAGNDLLVGWLGADTLDGGAGIDTANYAGSAGVVVDLAGGVAWDGGNLDALAGIENATGSAGADQLWGDAGANVLSGGAENDLLVGGLGADTLDGGAGIDTASYAGSASVVVDLAASVAWDGSNLDTLAGIENATGSSSADQLWGNAGANVLSGGAGNDLLVGWLGADTLDGGAGSDTVSYAGHGGVVVDLAGGVAWDGGNLDTLLGIENATGSASADQLWGDAGANVLSGAGGNDLLVGDAGADTFVFNTPLNSSSNVDTIKDFTGGSDKVLLDHAIFAALSAGSLSSGSFVGEAGAVAHDANDFVLYDTASGNLLYDPDGSGAQAATLFASLTFHPVLSLTDLLVI